MATTTTTLPGPHPHACVTGVAACDLYLERLEGWVSLADVVKVSRADLDWLYPGTEPDAAAAAWLARGPGLVVVTKGHDGVLGMTAQDRVQVAGTPVVVSDTVGAGDSFTSGLLARLQATGRLERSSVREIPADEMKLPIKNKR